MIRFATGRWTIILCLLATLILFASRRRPSPAEEAQAPATPGSRPPRPPCGSGARLHQGDG